MHFWIDKRSQTCGFDGRRYGVPPSLASGRRRNKSLVTPVHRLQAIENATISHQLRRSYQQSLTQPRPNHHPGTQCQAAAVVGNEPSNSSAAIARPNTPPEVHAPVCLDAPIEGALDTVSHAQFMRLGGLTKYGMWASFGLTTISVAATKFYVDHQGTFEILLLCTLGVLGAGLLVSCVITVCKKSASQQFLSVEAPAPVSPPPATELDIPEMSQADVIIPSLTTMTTSQSSTMEARTSHEAEQPPPPYDIAIYLPVKDYTSPDYPPPSYENAVR